VKVLRNEYGVEFGRKTEKTTLFGWRVAHRLGVGALKNDYYKVTIEGVGAGVLFHSPVSLPPRPHLGNPFFHRVISGGKGWASFQE
jgi:hypothetical protein